MTVDLSDVALKETTVIDCRYKEIEDYSDLLSRLFSALIIVRA